MAKYTIGLDFGTLSCRALLVDIKSGEEVCTYSFDYPHGVMDEVLPDGTKLGVDWALQHPQDYIDSLKNTIPEVQKLSGVAAEEVIGIGVDFTTCTVMPVKDDGTPLCFLPEYKSRPNAYTKLWKHHAAQDKANIINEVALSRGEKWISRYGNKVSSEWAVPKLWQILEEDPDIYDSMDHFAEAGDWVVWQLTGVQTKNSCMAGYKCMWHKTEGYPSKEFFKALDPRLENVVEEKFSCPVSPLGTKAGDLSEYGARLTGLKPGTAVAIAIGDAHASCPGTKIAEPGKLLMIMGTSTCHLIHSEEEHIVPGICGFVEDGVSPGLFCYEAGQACVGDHFAWFVNNCMPESYAIAARNTGMDPHEYLTEKASKFSPGESGIIALDWWNGNRSVLVDAELTGMFLGMTLQTKPEELYRALIEATAFGTRRIVQAYRENGVTITEVFATGGIARKNAMLMQIYADVLNIPIRIGGSKQSGALGSAILGAVAAGSEKGGYDDYYEATRMMGNLRDEVYMPIEDNVKPYNKLYNEYIILHDYFGRGTNDVMKRLRKK
ncbi:MAG: ribulokinase [Clostridiales bacterium]|nr:ribulokinase [Clostridiales bacterium]